MDVNITKINATKEQGDVIEIAAIDLWYDVVAVVLGALAITGNALIMFLIASRRRLQQTQNWLIFSLSTSDFLIGLSVITNFICVAVFRSWEISNTLKILKDSLFDVSSLNLCVLAADRCVAVFWPLRYHALVNRRKVITIIIMVWAIPAAIGLPYLSIQSDDTPANTLYPATLVLIFQTFPSVFMVIAYIRIFYVVYWLKKQEAIQINQLRFNLANSGPSRAICRPSFSITSIGSLVVCFALCNLVSSVRAVCWLLYDRCRLPVLLLDITTLLFYANAAVNFIVYSMVKSDFQREFLKFIKGCWCRAEVRVNTASTTTNNGVFMQNINHPDNVSEIQTAL
ncbi:predicted protein [Nematostella vectensis]|uniref:G-protein coupled receptors family 1 profile domain-containing protein n=1 Tax=Nematostella vectensis TaxID=45351 RepID=A7RKF1_NEMVE|nr:5-hydroxytryptamine receptor 6 [Nematostella vectensis]EDO48234.1 predicted protein [Nematostella vectensis]|eukprot:XP_001640297.1 predicted protein [Nematostella vectensis]